MSTVGNAQGDGYAETRAPSRARLWWDRPPVCQDVSTNAKPSQPNTPLTAVAQSESDPTSGWLERHHAKTGRVVIYDPKRHDGSLLEWTDLTGWRKY